MALTLPQRLVAQQSSTLPRNLQVVLDNTQAVRSPERLSLPLFVLPISNTLAGVGEQQAEAVLAQLDERRIAYTVDWNPQDFEASLAEGLRIARLQRKLGAIVAVNANACLYSFCDGSPETLHVDDRGQRFADTSFSPPLGCPFALEHRIPVIQERVERFLRGYQQAGIDIDFVFADWEIDGPIEWNASWSASRHCTRCCEQISNIDDFRTFQHQLREIRSRLQRTTFGDNVTHYFPQALVGNYGVYPHDGYRYWYDYFEQPVDHVPYLADQRARYREWIHEFEGTGYTCAMPVVYTWYPTFDWYDFPQTDYRWFYNMLKVGSNAGQNTDPSTPIVPFVHWNTTAPPNNPDPRVQQFSKSKYQALLWHLLMRGHDTFFLWCTSEELAEEIQLVHEVYAQASRHAGFIQRGTPISFDVPHAPEVVVSGLRLGEKILAYRTNFGDDADDTAPVLLADGRQLLTGAEEGLQLLDARTSTPPKGLLQQAGKLRFPIGFYELPAGDEALREMADAGVNLVRCANRDDLQRAHSAGMMGWVPLSIQQGATDALRQQIDQVVDHPALAVWEGPDEIVWTFTAYSHLAQSAGFTRDDWNAQTSRAVAYSEEKGAEIIPAMRAGIQLVRERDARQLPFWINEAADSDVKFVRQYIDSIDITGCDYYAVRSNGTDLPAIGRSVDRWAAIGRDRPVWMVLQAFSWHVAHPTRTRLYPTFAQSRFMAYDALVHGAKGILYWGSNEIDRPEFRTSLYALTAELAALESFLIEPPVEGANANIIGDIFDPAGLGVRARLFRDGTDYLLVLVNEDNHRHLGVDVTGLAALEARTLKLLYGSEKATVRHHGFATRLQPYEVKVFSTSDRYQSRRTTGRDYALPEASN